MKSTLKSTCSLKNSDGFTLVEIMIAVGLLGGLAIAGMSLFKNQNEAQKTVERNYEVTTTVNEIRGLLSNPVNCAASLSGVSPSSGTVTSLRKDINSVITTVFPASVMLPGGVMIKSYRLKNSYSNLASNETVLEVLFSRGKGTIKDDYMKQVKIVYTLSGANIVTCYAAASTSDSLWEISTTDPNDIYFTAGDVGVGIANPLTKLHVSADNSSRAAIDSSELFQIHGGASTYGTISNDSTRLLMGVWDNASNGVFTDQVNEGGYIGTTGTAPFHLRTNNTPRLYISNTGNVGIGTSNPVGLLTTYNANGAEGPIHMANNGSGSTNGVAVYNAGGTRVGFYGFRGSSANPPTPAGTTGYFWADSYTSLIFGTFNQERMRINQDGNVGIGTASPSAQLHATQGAIIDGLLLGESSPTMDMALAYESIGVNAGMNLRLQSPNSVYFHTGMTAAEPDDSSKVRMTIGSNGNVGIGTTSPSQKLTVAGDISTGGTSVNTAIHLYNSANVETAKIDANGTSWISGGALAVGTTNAGGEIFRVEGRADFVTLLNDHGVRIRGDSTDNHGILQFTNNAFSTQWGTISMSNSPRRMNFVIDSTVYAYVDNSGITANAFYYSSDERLKRSISPLNNALHRILKLQGHEYIWRSSGEKTMGFVAQEVEKHEPTLVKTDEKGMKSVSYANITALIVEAIKELFSDQEDLREEVKTLKEENRLLKERLDRLEAARN